MIESSSPSNLTDDDRVQPVDDVEAVSADERAARAESLRCLRLKLLTKHLRQSRVIAVGFVFIFTCLLCAGIIEIYLRFFLPETKIVLPEPSSSSSNNNQSSGITNLPPSNTTSLEILNNSSTQEDTTEDNSCDATASNNTTNSNGDDDSPAATSYKLNNQANNQLYLARQRLMRFEMDQREQQQGGQRPPSINIDELDHESVASSAFETVTDSASINADFESISEPANDDVSVLENDIVNNRLSLKPIKSVEIAVQTEDENLDENVDIEARNSPSNTAATQTDFIQEDPVIRVDVMEGPSSNPDPVSVQLEPPVIQTEQVQHVVPSGSDEEEVDSFVGNHIDIPDDLSEISDITLDSCLLNLPIDEEFIGDDVEDEESVESFKSVQQDENVLESEVNADETPLNESEVLEEIDQTATDKLLGESNNNNVDDDGEIAVTVTVDEDEGDESIFVPSAVEEQQGTLVEPEDAEEPEIHAHVQDSDDSVVSHCVFDNIRLDTPVTNIADIVRGAVRFTVSRSVPLSDPSALLDFTSKVVEQADKLSYLPSSISEPLDGWKTRLAGIQERDPQTFDLSLFTRFAEFWSSVCDFLQGSHQHMASTVTPDTHQHDDHNYIHIDQIVTNRKVLDEQFSTCPLIILPESVANNSSVSIESIRVLYDLINEIHTSVYNRPAGLNVLDDTVAATPDNNAIIVNVRDRCLQFYNEMVQNFNASDSAKAYNTFFKPALQQNI